MGKVKVPVGRFAYADCPSGLNKEVFYKIRQRRLQMLIHSHIYYRLAENIVGDKLFDKWAYELRDLQKDYLEESKACELSEAFDGWDGTTGFHLPYYNWVDGIAQHLLKLDKKQQ